MKKLQYSHKLTFLLVLGTFHISKGTIDGNTKNNFNCALNHLSGIDNICIHVVPQLHPVTNFQDSRKTPALCNQESRSQAMRPAKTDEGQQAANYAAVQETDRRIIGRESGIGKIQYSLDPELADPGVGNELGLGFPFVSLQRGYAWSKGSSCKQDNGPLSSTGTVTVARH